MLLINRRFKQMNTTKILILMSGYLLFGPLMINAQTEKELLTDLLLEEQEAVNAIVLYPVDVRNLIFEATQYPEVLIKIENIHSRTSQAFLAIVENDDREVQEMLWDLSRYPNLIPRLVKVRDENPAELEKALINYPEIIHPRAKEAFKYDMELLIRIDELKLSAEQTFQDVLSSYPPDVRDLFIELIELPEVLSILTEHIKLTILVGDVYKNQPEWIIKKADSLHLEVAKQNAEELENWKKSLAENPQAQTELEESAESYQSGLENDQYYDYDEEPEVIVQRVYYNYHYPYWFGYPHWYNYPRWRCYPSWYYLGFYPSLTQGIIVVNLPSFHFMYWYFLYPSHHYRYSRLSAHFVGHYRDYRYASRNSISSAVDNWRQTNRNVISKDWLNNDDRLPNRFREYGAFELDRSNYNRQNLKNQVSKEDFLQSRTQRYPAMNKSHIEINKQTTSIRKPRNISEVRRPQNIKRPHKIEVQKQKIDRNRIINTQPGKSSRIIKQGRDYHKQTWDRSRQSAKRPSVRKKPTVRSMPRSIPKKPMIKPKKKSGN